MSPECHLAGLAAMNYLLSPIFRCGLARLVHQSNYFIAAQLTMFNLARPTLRRHQLLAVGLTFATEQRLVAAGKAIWDVTWYHSLFLKNLVISLTAGCLACKPYTAAEKASAKNSSSLLSA